MDRIAVRCIDPSGAAYLHKNQLYFAEANGDSHYYIFHKNNKSFNPRGCYQKKRFQVIDTTEETWPQEPISKEIKLDKDKLYIADLIYRTKGYQGKELGKYYLKPQETHAFFYRDKQLKEFCGSFPLHWFDNFEEISEIAIEKKEIFITTEDIETEQLSLQLF